MVSSSLLQKYNVPTPRYTSYPTVPHWEGNLTESCWIDLVKKSYGEFGQEQGISLYIHLPYCENLCTYCGCNKRITKNHAVELPYIESVLKEWQHYLDILPQKPKLAGIHLGGGTPTFFSPEALTLLVSTIRSSTEVLPVAEFSFEGHPNNTTLEHLEALYAVGFTRVSYGIQDFDEKVQKAIHRIQPFEKVREATHNARNIGYDSVNFDLLYGLPHQTVETITQTFNQVAGLKPDRIAFYSYAHVPHMFPAQKHFENFLPTEEEKRQLQEKGKALLVHMGYEEVGMDHFSLPQDPLFIAKNSGKLHRNFMGYTTSPSAMLIGLGNSSISDIGYAYAQNNKEISSYKADITLGRFPLQKGHIQTAEDQEIRQLILDIICQEKATWGTEFFLNLSQEVMDQLDEMVLDGLIIYGKSGLQVTSSGKAWVRNICSIFDKKLNRKKTSAFPFSKVV